MNKLNLIIGEDTKTINFYLTNILNDIEHNEDSVINVDLSTNKLSDILDEASTINLFGGNKVIIGSNLDVSKLTDDEISYLNKYTESSSNNSYIILISKKIDARTKVYKIFKNNFNIIDTEITNNNEVIYDYTKKLIKDKKYQISEDNFNYLMSKIDLDINNINNELNKLFIYKSDTLKIEREDIDKLIIDNIENIVYEFSNAILDKDTDKIIKMYHNFQIQNVSFDYLISLLFNSFHQSLVIKIMHNNYETNLKIASAIGKKEFFVKKTLERLEDYTITDLARLIDKLMLIDRNFKTGKSNFDYLELFLISN